MNYDLKLLNNCFTSSYYLFLYSVVILWVQVDRVIAELKISTEKERAKWYCYCRLWGTFLADVVIQMIGTDYARIVQAIFAFAQVNPADAYKAYNLWLFLCLSGNLYYMKCFVGCLDGGI